MTSISKFFQSSGMIKNVLGCFLAAFLTTLSAQAQISKERWVDSVFQTMTISDKVGQLFVIKVSPDADKAELDKLERKIKSDNLGGVLFTTGSLIRQIDYTNRFRSSAKVPLLIGVEGTSGIGRVTDSLHIRFPVALAQGAVADDSLLIAMAQQLAKYYHSLGVNLNFINATTGSPSDTRADSFFAENRFTVTDKVLQYWKAIQPEGILACARDFPLRAVKEIQSQKGPAVLKLTTDSLEVYPFRTLFKDGLPAVTVSAEELSLFYPEKKNGIKNLFSDNALPPAFARNWIQSNMNYIGLTFIDVDRLKNGTRNIPDGDGEIFAFQAGLDLQITADDVDGALRKMKKFFKKEKQFRGQLDETVRRILSLKFDAGLSRPNPVEAERVIHDFQTPEQQILRQKLYKASITVIKNETASIPLRTLDEKRFIFIAADDSVKGRLVAEKLGKYVGFSLVTADGKKELPKFQEAYRPKHVIVVAVFPNSKEETLQRLFSNFATADKNREIIICDFGSSAFRNFAQFFPTVISGYADDEPLLQLLPEVIFGALGSNGILPVTYGQIPAGTSVNTEPLNRLSYSIPEDAQLNSKTLEKIEFIANEAINAKATPGCHVLVARNGKVVYEKSFGYLTYEKQSPVSSETIYDLASVTKVAATLQAVMFMYDKGLIDLNRKASYYLPELKNSNKKDFILKDILTHQAGLWPFLPFWAQTMKDTLYLPEYYSKTLTNKYPLVVADKLYGNIAMKDSLWSWIVKAKVREKPARTPYDYRYSDMGFYIMQHLAERILNQPIEDFLAQNLYEPLGATTLGYLPLLRFPIAQIAPTENDKLFRRALLIGTVHDQGAAMQGGIAGHAGLFGNANDLAKLGQMLLRNGEYGGIKYYRPEVVKLFTSKQFETSKRGLGWDKPAAGEWNGATSYYASGKTFGHTGFTGTCIWVDPEFDLVYIFLSNRVHPDMTNNKLLNANIRSRIQDVIYQAIFDYCKTAGGEHPMPVSTTVEALGQSQ